MLEQFSDEALAVWGLSSHLASERGQKWRDELHLLLAIITSSQLGSLILGKLGVDVRALTEQIQRMLPNIQPNAQKEDLLPMTPSLKAAIEQAIICTNRVEFGRLIDPSLLLVGIVRRGQGSACELLTSLDVSEIRILAFRSHLLLRAQSELPPRVDRPPDQT